jgi:uncharacterized protein YdhG (YjbR/CyaY superfamily)
MRTGSFETVDQYLAGIASEDARASLARLRAIILDEIPDAQESICYGMPMYKVHGMVAGFAAFKNHCSFFPGHTVAEFGEELKDFKTSKGTIQFTQDRPLPEKLVRDMVRRRAEENTVNAEQKGKEKRSS